MDGGMREISARVQGTGVVADADTYDDDDLEADSLFSIPTRTRSP